DLSGSRLGQAIAETYVSGLGNGAHLLRHPVTQVLSDGFGFVSGRGRLLEHDEGHHCLRGSRLRPPDNGALGHQLVRHERRLDLGTAKAVTRDAQDIVGTPQNPEVAVFVALSIVASHVHPAQLFREVAVAIARRISPYRADHGRPRSAYYQKPTGSGRELIAGFIDDCGVNAG